MHMSAIHTRLSFFQTVLTAVPPLRFLPCGQAKKLATFTSEQANKNAPEFLLKRFLFKSATTYFHAPFPANYLRHK